MKADTLSLKSLFQKDVRYEVPTFQRPYVWNQEDQWEPLWEDVRNCAERYLDELALASGDNVLAEERTDRHFMGAVVVQQRPTSAAEVETRLIIDGQQRLTTMQLLLDAAQEELHMLGHDAQALRLARLVLNQFEMGDSRFKLWPTQLDREAFRAAMENGSSSEHFAQSPIVQAHDFFRLQVNEWLMAAEAAERELMAQALEATLLGLLELVVIDLGTGDDAYVIFETLNARGTPLLASDLIKNFLLQQYSAMGHTDNRIYDRYWRVLDDRWWREEVRQGRIVRPRIDQLLNYWLSMRTGSEISASHLFPAFRSFVEDNALPVDSVAADIASIARTYRDLDEYPRNSPMEIFLYRWSVLDAGVATPLLLWILEQPSSRLPDEGRMRMLRALESFLVRRMICRSTTKNYNQLFIEAVQQLRDPAIEPPDEHFIEFLAAQTADARLWPTDRDVSLALLELPLYRLLTRARMRMLLEAVEDDLRSPKTEVQFVTRDLSIEHVLPQAWRTHWPIPRSEDPLTAEQTRDRALHTIGNLTLVTQKLNSDLSHAPWPQKRQTLFEHTTLLLNKDLISTFDSDVFDEASIRRRGREIVRRVLSIWPGPEDLRYDS